MVTWSMRLQVAGGNAKFDLCGDSRSADAVMGGGVGIAMGTAVKLDHC